MLHFLCVVTMIVLGIDIGMHDIFAYCHFIQIPCQHSHIFIVLHHLSLPLVLYKCVFVIYYAQVISKPKHHANLNF
jgi:hypothetical protein